MAEMKERKRKSPRNYRAEVEHLIMYCKVSIEVLTDGTGQTEFANGKLSAFRSVLGQLEKE